MFEKILVANRGEIAVRIIRACKELNIRTVAVYSEADSNSMHVQMADEAICIGKAPASESYLKIDRIISAAEIADVDAIHPGYGFLSENAHFADVCESCNIRFIGPSSRTMNALADKAVSRTLAKKAGVPVPAYRSNGATFNDGKFAAVWHMQTNYVTDATAHGFNASSIPVPSGITATSGLRTTVTSGIPQAASMPISREPMIVPAWSSASPHAMSEPA